MPGYTAFTVVFAAFHTGRALLVQHWRIHRDSRGASVLLQIEHIYSLTVAAHVESRFNHVSSLRDLIQPLDVSPPTFPIDKGSDQPHRPPFQPFWPLKRPNNRIWGTWRGAYVMVTGQKRESAACLVSKGPYLNARGGGMAI